MLNTYYHLCNPGTPEPSGCRNIIAKGELLAIQEDEGTVYLIHIHLNWEGRKLSSDFGFDIANEIRMEKGSRSPIIFYSPAKVEYFEYKSRSDLKYKILFGRGSAFIEAPFEEAALHDLANGLQPLSKAALHDVVTMLCNVKGVVIDKLNHDLKFDADIDKVIGSVSPYLSAIQKKEISLEKFVFEIKESIKAKQPKKFVDLKTQFITICNQRLTEKGKEVPSKKRTKHKVLLVDDVADELHRVKSFLQDAFTVEDTNSALEAISILKKDTRNEIVAVISDWRLFTDQNQNYWQPLQGYEVLDFAAKNGIRSLLTLTSQADFVVHQLRNLMGVRFSLFKKENLETADQWQVFKDVLFEACEEAVNARASILDEFKSWDKAWERKGIPQPTLKEQYIAYWNSADRESASHQIERKTEELWERLRSDRGVFMLGQADLADWGFSNKVFDLQKTLVIRRLWFGQWFYSLPGGQLGKKSISEHAVSVYEKLIGGGSSGSMGQKLYTLCIQQDKIKKEYMLPEEIDWLMKKELM
ncbi:MAG: hypothetical protein H6581_05390 [Bacteroidia bacterium]|nr:hypothetical protein [Bacteroidia bacterium]